MNRRTHIASQFKKEGMNLPLGTSYFCQYIHRRILSNKNFLGAIIGPTGSGKSYAALSLMEILGRSNLDNVCLTAKDFLKRIDCGELKKGDVLIWDEAGIDLNAREWQSVSNRVIHNILQTFRSMNLIVFFTVPYFSFIDIGARKLLHSKIHTQRVNIRDKTCILKPFLLQVNQDTGKIYRKYLRVRGQAGGLTPVERMCLPIPKDEIRIPYEIKKKKFQEELNKKMIDKLEKHDKKNNPKLKPLTMIQATCFHMEERGASIPQIAQLLAKSPETVRQSLKEAKIKLQEAYMRPQVPIPR